MMLLENTFDIGQMVYLKTDPEQSARLVIGIQLTRHDMSYLLALGGMTSWHYDFEISTERDVMRAVVE